MAGGMQAVQGGLNSLMLFSCKPARQHERHARKSPEGAKMYQVESFSWLCGRHARKLVNESVGTFIALQNALMEVEPDNCIPILVKKSREYRSMIQACIGEIAIELQSMDSVDNPSDEQEDLAQCEQLLSKMELVMSLIEILFVDTKPGCVVLEQLVSWIHHHFPKCRDKAEEALMTDHPHQHPAYWDAVYGFVLQGQMESARNLLSKHASAATEPFISMDELLRKMPVFQVYSGVSEAEFTVRWQHWQSECERRLQDGHFTTCHQLSAVCQILCGDLSTINSLIDLMDTWYHLMVSTLLFTNPTIKLFRLYAAAQDAINTIGGEERISSFDQILLAAMESDAHEVNGLMALQSQWTEDLRVKFSHRDLFILNKSRNNSTPEEFDLLAYIVIKACQVVLDNNWFTAHVIDLLYHTLSLKTEQRFLPELRESLLLDYASMLVGHSSLWQVGILYLDHCGPEGNAMSQAVLQRIPLTDDSRACKVIQMASDREFDNVVVGVCRVMGRRALSQNRLGAAIWWSVRSRDSAFTSYLAHQILQKYVAEGKFESSPLLDHLGPAMLLSDTLTFLGKYREFHTMYQDGNFNDAASLLVSLISSKLAPEYFWPVLLLDALPLLKSEDPVISSEQTYELMYCLHNLSQSTDKNKESPMDTAAAKSAFADKEKEIRLALSNNLARAIIQEGTVIED